MAETKNYHFLLAIPRHGLSGKEHQIIKGHKEYSWD